MKNGTLLACLAVIIAISSCKSFSPALLRPESSDLTQSLLRLDIGQPSTQKTTSSESKEVSVQSYLYTLFQRELEANIFMPDGKTHGSIEMSIIYLDQKLGVWGVISGLTLFVLPLFGFPIYNTICQIETEIRVYNNEGKSIKKYDYLKGSTINWSFYKKNGFYYWERKAMDEHVVLLFREILKEFRSDILEDSNDINLILMQQHEETNLK